MKTVIVYSSLLLLTLPIAGCSNLELSQGFNWLMKIAGLLAAIGAIGNFYFENKIKAQESKFKNELDAPQVINVGSENYKEWLVEKDSPIIIEALDVIINFNVVLDLMAGDSFSVDKFSTWKFDGDNPFLEFQRKWEGGEISLDQLNGTLNTVFTKFQVEDINHNLVFRPIIKANANYSIFKTYYLTNTNSLPSSKTIKNFGTKINNRIFKEEDLLNFNLKNFQKFSSIEDIPGQSGQVIKFLLKPKIHIN